MPTYDLSTTEAAAILGVHVSTVKAWADAGAIPFWLTPGKHRRFNRADLERFLELPESEPAT